MASTAALRPAALQRAPSVVLEDHWVPAVPEAKAALHSPVGQPARPAAHTHNSVQFGPVGRWWDDKSVMRTVGLNKEQQKKMDSIFDENKPAILASYKTFLSRQSKLNSLNKDPKVDKTQLFAAIDAVNEARSALEKTTAQMFLEIRQQMSPEQIEKLGKLP
jgi:Spy/CpxP family protein refolding chaperone